jgi:hypothetical protein
VNVFGRLAPGVTIESAQAELSAIGERLSASVPATHQHLRPRVLPYPQAYNDMDDPENAIVLQAIHVAIVLMLVVVCVNVAILVYARTATRQSEIAVRGALGASRRRIVAQLFVEALLLAGIAAAAGVAFGSTALQVLQGQMLIVGGRVLPFWMSLRLERWRALHRRTHAAGRGDYRRGPGRQRHGPSGPHRLADALAGRRVAHADGPDVDDDDRGAGGVDRGADADGNFPGVDGAAGPPRRFRVCVA